MRPVGLLPRPPTLCSSYAIPCGAVWFGGRENDDQCHQYQHHADADHECTKHGYEWRFYCLRLGMNGNFEVLEVTNHTFQESVFRLHQLVLVHDVDVRGAYPAG